MSEQLISIARLETCLEGLECRMDRFEKHITDQNTETQAILRDMATSAASYHALIDQQRKILENQEKFRDRHKEIEDKITSYQSESRNRHSDIERRIDNIHSIAKPVIWLLGIVVPLVLAAVGNMLYQGFINHLAS